MIAPKFTRTTDWWEPKITLVISIGLLAIYLYGNEISYSVIGFLFILILSISIGAVYVSLINDFTDLEDDLKAGKKNKLQSFSRLKQLLLIFTSATIILFFAYLFWSYGIGSRFLVGAMVIYTLYSFPPIRLKKRGLWGVLADAFGAHVFPAMGIFALLSEFLIQSVDWTALTSIGFWSLLYGVRGILSHQYLDLEYDKSVGVKTFATRFSIDKIKRVEWPLLLLEVTALVGSLIYLELYFLIFLLCIYYLYILLLNWGFGIKHVVLLQPIEPNWNILMATYYQVLLPIGLLGMLGVLHPWVYLLIPAFVLVFPNDILRNSALVVSLSQPKEIPKA
jgi:4-hydroxybenzoate polyprenyltransferase